MFKIDLTRISAAILFAFVFFIGANLYAQNDKMSDANNTYKQNAQKWTAQLNQKVNLTQDQQTSIEGILVDYQNAKTKTNMANSDQFNKTYDQKIQAVLNDNQKQAYKDYSAQWWGMMSKSKMGKTDKKQY